MVGGIPWQNGSNAEIIELLGQGAMWPVRYTLNGFSHDAKAAGLGGGKVKFWGDVPPPTGWELTAIRRPEVHQA